MDKTKQSSTTPTITATTTTTTPTPIPSTTIAKEGEQSLPPLILPGGSWEGGRKVPLEEHHYLPMQPVLKAKRRPTSHNQESLFQYLKEQSKIEELWLQQNMMNNKPQQNNNINNEEEEEEDKVITSSLSSTSSVLLPNIRDKEEGGKTTTTTTTTTVYMDGVFDLFHVGHLEAIQQCASLGDRVIIGVTGDIDATGYKRPPIISQSNRVAIIEALQVVDVVICPCPLIVTKTFMSQYNIDLVVHGFATDEDALKQEEFFRYPMKVNKFKRISYYNGLSTTDIINKIQTDKVHDDDNNNDDDDVINKNEGGEEGERTEEDVKKELLSEAQLLALRKPQWFGAAVTAAATTETTNKRNPTNDLMMNPFPILLRNVIEPFIRKATIRREEVLNAIKQASSEYIYNDIISKFNDNPISKEGDFIFDINTYPLLASLLKCSQFP
eukprot:CAMPEP_0114364112 /NCGR_PEP_ID=MMETSP0101-20121206/27215_1 /TAXON_ID=38822 ORGANISM="Pteridomonas danica, Strain PT" /NCGR_SAMPLE_ID=MMETSP0101 /ASSEMBLY_ACC=CAM_ASM_000211 /LENGTH=439 /DNA_ID=CAMNT_0001511377 /DNA_START=656 /DNA_END=1972 /DNA_ORIENTATION=+